MFNHVTDSLRPYFSHTSDTALISRILSNFSRKFA